MRRHRLAVPATIAVVLLAACSSDGGDGETATETIAAEGGVVALTGTDRLRWSAEQITADTGDLTFELTCEEAVNHNLVIGTETVAECAPGGTDTGSISLDAGDHRFLCNVPGHERTMRGTITVEG